MKLLFHFLLFLFCVRKASTANWCFLKPNPFKKARQNWDFCFAKTENTMYRFTIRNYDEDGADFIGAMTIQVLGQDSQTKVVELGKTFVRRGQLRVFYFSALVVPNIIGAKVKAIGKGNFKCMESTLEVGMKSWYLDCPIIEFENKEATETDLELAISGNQVYNVFVKSSSLQRKYFKGIVYITFMGEFGQTGKKILAKYGFDPGSMEKIMVVAQDIGAITGIILETKSKDEWLPELVEIKKVGGASMQFNLMGKSLKCPPSCVLEIDNRKNEDKCVKDEDLITSEKTLTRTFHGEALTPTEQSQLIRLRCKDTVKSHPKFQFDFPGKHVNPMTIMAICPGGCTEVKKLKVYGDYLHPEESSICGAAFIDKAMSAYGGVIGVTVFNGMDYYSVEKPEDPEEKSKQNTETEEESGESEEMVPFEDGTLIEKAIFGNSKKSFFVYKIDNIDMVGNPIRIINAMGTLSDFGRLEFRPPGMREWGTICAMNTNATTGKVACDSLGYYGGEVKNPYNERGMNYCQDINQVNYCGKKGVANNIAEINCKGDEKTLFMGCGNYNISQINNICPEHTYDLVVECYKFDRNLLINPPPGTIRILNAMNKPATDGVGRLEMFFDGWGSVCNKEFDVVSAKVACKQMGFLDGQFINDCSKVNGNDLCGKEEMQINARNVVCKGAEEKIDKCQLTFNSEGCMHSNDVVLSCSGGESDPSGITQIVKSITRFAEPKISKDYPIKELLPKCETSLLGDKTPIGDLFLLDCPANCHREPGILFGYFVYEASSPICKAAYHSGVIGEDGGRVMVVRLGTISFFDSVDSRGYKSSTLKSEAKAYAVTKPNSLAEKFLEFKKEEAKKKSFFMFLQDNYSIHKRKNSLFPFFNAYRFMTTKEKPEKFFDKNPPTFSWAPPYKGYKFQGCFGIETKDFPNADGTLAGKDFTIMMKLKLGKKLARNQFIIGNSLSCINIFLDTKNIVVLAKMNPYVEFSTQYVLGKGEKTMTFKYMFIDETIQFFVNEKMMGEEKINFNFFCGKEEMVIGGQAGGSYHFVGEIKYFQMWKFPLPEEMLMFALSKGLIEPQKAKTMREYSKRGEPCLSACRDSPLPGEPLAPSEPENARLGLPYYGTRVGEPSKIEGMPGAAKSEDYFVPPVVLFCDDQATKSQFQATYNTSILVRCPKDCHQDKTGVFGTLIYAETSSICRAGIHAGYIDKYEGGEFYVIIVPGEEQYEGSFINGILSLDYSGSMKSFKLRPFKNVKKIGCHVTPMEDDFQGNPNDKFTVYCKPNCKEAPPLLYGIGPFSIDSSICQGAIYSGVIGDAGGIVTFTLKDGRSVLPAGVSNDMKSSDRIRIGKCFTFNNNNTCHYFAETMNNFNVANFKVLGSATWDVVESPYSLGKVFAILKYSSADQDIPGTVIMRNSFHCSDGILKFKFSRKAGNIMAVMRYFDNKNYLLVEISPSTIKVNLQNEGFTEFSGSKPFKFKNTVWYRVSIIFYDKSLKVFIGEGNDDDFVEVLSEVLPIVKAGYGGVGASGKAFFKEIAFESYDPRKTSVDFMLPGIPYSECLNYGNIESLKKRCKELVSKVKAFDMNSCTNAEANCANCCASTSGKKDIVTKCLEECAREFPVKSEKMKKIMNLMQ